MDKVRETAMLAAREGGAILKERLGKIRTVDYKSAFNIVTDVDKAAEKCVLEILNAQFPDYSVLAEESGALSKSDKRRWLIDPLDGTTNYTHGYPFFCVSIGLEDQGQVVLGVVYNPISDEMFWAQKGKGAFLGSQPIKVSTVTSLSSSLLTTGFPPDTHAAAKSNMLEFSTLTDISHGVRRDGSAALDLCFVAAGRTEGFWEMKLAPWDLAAGTLMVQEAGGKVTNLTGGDFDISTGHVLASNGLIHNQVVQILSKLQ